MNRPKYDLEKVYKETKWVSWTIRFLSSSGDLADSLTKSDQTAIKTWSFFFHTKWKKKMFQFDLGFLYFKRWLSVWTLYKRKLIINLYTVYGRTVKMNWAQLLSALPIASFFCLSSQRKTLPSASLQSCKMG